MPNIDFDALDLAVDAQLTLLGHTGEEVGRGWVPVEDIAWNTYGSMVGINCDRLHVTDAGYIVYSHLVRSGFGCTGVDQVAVYLADRPDGDPDTAEVLYVDPGSVVTVLDPPDGQPPGEASPWTRMPIEHQVIAAGHLLGVTVRAIDAEPNPLYQVDDDPPTALSRVADYLLAGGFARSLGRARPIPHPNRVRRPS
jgi:hypothetical protein